MLVLDQIENKRFCSKINIQGLGLHLADSRKQILNVFEFVAVCVGRVFLDQLAIFGKEN